MSLCNCSPFDETCTHHGPKPTAPATAREIALELANELDGVDHYADRLRLITQALDAAVARALNEMADSILAVPLETSMEVYHALRQRALRATEAGG